MTKSPIQSLTLWALFVTLIAWLADRYKWLGITDASETAYALTQLGGLAVAAYGRFRARAQLAIVSPPDMRPPSYGLIVLLLLAPGCQAVGLMPVAEHKAALAVIKNAEGNESAEYLAWARSISKQPNAAPLPDLAPFTQEQRDAWYRSREQRRLELGNILSE